MTGQQLKNSILQMAVQGKLVPQDPNDEPASVLLEKIRKEKEQLIKEGKIKKEKNPSYIFRGADNLPYEKVGKNEPVCIADEIPFEIPKSWEWVRISSLGSIVRGSGIKRTETVEFGKPCVRYGELYTTYHTSFNQAISFVSEELFERCKHFSYGDILMTLTGENKPDIAKSVTYLGDEVIAAGGDLAYWTAHGMNPLYLTYLMASPYVVGRKINLATGDIIVHISGEKLGTILIPIPPLSEQQRIVEKILEVEVKLEEYAGKENSLNILQKNFPDILKKSILQEAIQGKLVPQDSGDEPASVLLERIRVEKQKLIAEGKIKKDKHESFIFRRDNSHYEKLDGIERCIDDEIPFEIPNNWVWTSVGEVCTNIQYGSSQKSSPTGKIAVLRMGNLQNGRIVLDKLVYTSDSKEIEKYPLEYNDLLFNRTNSKELVGKVAIYKSEIPAIYAGYLVRLHPILIDSDYLNYVMQSQYYWIYCQKVRSDAIGQSNINAEKLKRFIFPLPPLQEQKRIVNQISCVMRKIQHL